MSSFGLDAQFKKKLFGQLVGVSFVSDGIDIRNYRIVSRDSKLIKEKYVLIIQNLLTDADIRLNVDEVLNAA